LFQENFPDKKRRRAESDVRADAFPFAGNRAKTEVFGKQKNGNGA